MPQSKILFRSSTKSSSQSGNIFVFILVGIFLFGALIYTFTRTSETGNSNFTKQESGILAQEIISYANLLRNAVERVRTNGCSETEISFENAVNSRYVNPNSPSDKSCHIFEPEGGKIRWNSAFDKFTQSINTVHCISQIGTCPSSSNKGSDLVYYIKLGSYPEHKQLCNSLNKILKTDNQNLDPTPENFSLNFNEQFQGVYQTNSGGLAGILAGTGITGEISACAQDDVGSFNGHYAFYSVLFAR